MSQCLQKKLSITLELCNGITVFEAAAMLHDTDAEFAVIDSALKTKKYLVPSIDGTGTKKVPQYFSTVLFSVVHF